jgi:hypothetical protein
VVSGLIKADVTLLCAAALLYKIIKMNNAAMSGVTK